MVENPPVNVKDIRDSGSIHWWQRSPGGEHVKPLQCPCLESPMERGTWWATVHRVPKIRTQLKQLSTLTHVYIALCQICFLIIQHICVDNIITCLQLSTCLYLYVECVYIYVCVCVCVCVYRICVYNKNYVFYNLYFNSKHYTFYIWG